MVKIAIKNYKNNLLNMNKKKKDRKDKKNNKKSKITNYKSKKKHKKDKNNNSSSSKIGFKKDNIFKKNHDKKNESSFYLNTPRRIETENIINKTLNSTELNLLPYDLARKIDTRTYIQYYISLIKYKQKIIFSFCTSEDYNSKENKISLFFLSFSLYYVTNGLFFNDSTMHKIYEDNGQLNFIYQLPIIAYSTIISSVINIIINFLSLTEKSIIELKKTKNDMKKRKLQLIKAIKIKISIYYMFTFLLLLMFWYYISCFCMVYRNTQILLTKNTIISFCTGLLYPFGLSLLPGLFRIPALKSKKKNKKCLYKISNLLQII